MRGREHGGHHRPAGMRGTSLTVSPNRLRNNHFKVIVPGRVARVTLSTAENQKLHVNFVHNQNLSAGDMRSIESLVNEDVRMSNNDPEHHCSIYMGDFNLTPKGSTPFVMSNPIPPNRNVAPDANLATRPYQTQF